MANIRIRGVKAAGSRINEVTAFGHRQRDDANPRIGHLPDQ